MGLRFQLLAAVTLAVVLALLLGGSVLERIRFEERRGGIEARVDRLLEALDEANAPREVLLEYFRADEAKREEGRAIVRFYALLTGAVLLFVLYVFLTLAIVRPIERLKRAADRLEFGRREHRAPLVGPREIRALAESMNAMAARKEEAFQALEEKLEEVERAQAALVEARDQLIRSEKLASLGRLSAGIAHEVGNPLASILGLLELSRDGAEEPELIDRAMAETRRIREILQELLVYARKDDRAEGDPVAAVERAIELFSLQRESEAIRIVRAYPNDRTGALPAVNIAEARLTQLVLNLLLNARDAMSAEGEIRIAAKALDDSLILTIEDEGHGIDEDIAPQLFEPFFTTKGAGEGTGLGLSIAATILERVGGSISISNRAEADGKSARGARVRIELPLVETKENRRFSA